MTSQSAFQNKSALNIASIVSSTIQELRQDKNRATKHELSGVNKEKAPLAKEAGRQQREMSQQIQQSFKSRPPHVSSHVLKSHKHSEQPIIPTN